MIGFGYSASEISEKISEIGLQFAFKDIAVIFHDNEDKISSHRVDIFIFNDSSIMYSNPILMFDILLDIEMEPHDEIHLVKSEQFWFLHNDKFELNIINSNIESFFFIYVENINDCSITYEILPKDNDLYDFILEQYNINLIDNL